MMTTKDMVAYYVLGITDIIDKICDNFSAADFTSEDLECVICGCAPYRLKDVGNRITYNLYNDIIDDAVERYGMDESKFDYYVDGLCSSLTYDGNTINSEKDLQKYASWPK
ncbi:MAG: hypothetical protein ACI3YB_01940 [Prevotella sp.]